MLSGWFSLVDSESVVSVCVVWVWVVDGYLGQLVWLLDESSVERCTMAFCVVLVVFRVSLCCSVWSL